MGRRHPHRDWLARQGDAVAFKGVLALPQKYVIHSVEPVGLVAKAVLEDGYP